MSVKVKITGQKELAAAMKKAGNDARRLAAAAIFQEAERVMAKSKEESPVGTDGVLRASGFVRPPEDNGRKITVELGYGGAAQSYAAAVHEGTRPHFPPVDALKPWARKFLGDEDLAFVVARKISRVGTKPTKFLERPLREAASGMGERIAAKIRAGLGA